MMWLDKALEDAGVGKFHALHMLLMSSFWMYGGGEMLLISTVTSTMEEAWDISPRFKAWTASFSMVGMLIGGLTGGAFADAIGRRPTFLVCIGGVALFGTVAALAVGPLTFSVCCVMVETFWGGGASACLSLVAETAPPGSRDQLVNVLVAVPFVFGEVYVCSLMLMFMPVGSDVGQEGWRKAALGWASLAVAGFVCSLLYLDETPYFLEAAGWRERAVDAVRRIAKWNGLDCPQDDGDASSDGEEVEGAQPGGAPRSSADNEGDEGGTARPCRDPVAGSASGCAQANLVPRLALSEVVEESTILSQYMEIFTPELRARVFAGCFLCFVGDVLCFGTIFILPLVFKQLEEQLHYGISPTAETLIACSFGFLCIFMGMASLATFGLPNGVVVLAIAAAVLQAGMSTISSGDEYVAFAISATCLFKPVSIAFMNSVYVYVARVFPLECRCTAMAFCFSAGRFGPILAPLAFSALGELTGGPAAYMLSVVILAAAAALVASREPEIDHAPVADGTREIARLAACMSSSSLGRFATPRLYAASARVVTKGSTCSSFGTFAEASPRRDKASTSARGQCQDSRGNV